MIYDPYSREMQEDPYPAYAHFREREPCSYNPKMDFYALFRFDDVWDATLDWQTYSSSLGPTLENRGQVPGELMSVIGMDPPRHVKIRNLAPARGVFLTPPWIGIHDGSFDSYDGGQPASTPLGGDEIERIAEDGDTASITATFDGCEPEWLCIHVFLLPQGRRCPSVMPYDRFSEVAACSIP